MKWLKYEQLKRELRNLPADEYERKIQEFCKREKI